MKVSSKVHGILDYASVLFLLLSPTLFGLPEVTSYFTYALGGIHLVLTALTKFELGIIKVIPLKVHGFIEAIAAVALVAVAFYRRYYRSKFLPRICRCISWIVVLN